MSHSLIYNQLFRKQLEQLNPAQRKAVETTEGPVLVIAGPGTGKTQILSARIGNILSSEDLQVQPHNILCLTFTDAGTVAMRKRLLQFIGPDAYRVHVYTFHGFCNQVIQENLDYFGVRNLQPVSELETIELFEKLINNFDSSSKLKRFKGDIYYDQEGLKDLFRNMKKEGWSEAFMYQQLDQYLLELKDNPEHQYKRNSGNNKKGDLKASYYTEVERMEKLRAAIAEFANFNREMLQIRRYDYDDMILWVLRAFKENNLLLRNYQERYQYILVDEYQDTSGSQNEIVELLTSYWDKPNLFVVGDDDQSIYRFQGANIKNIVDFNIKYKPELIVLKENYRSTQAILDASMAVIQHNQERLVTHVQGLDKNLISKGKVAGSMVKPRIVEYYNELHEEAALVKRLEELHNTGVDLSEVAVIYRNHSKVADIIKVLEKRRIPLNIKQKINVLHLPFVQNMLDILQYLQKENEYPDSGEEQLFRLMHFDYFHIDQRDIAVLAKEIIKFRRDEKKISWRELMTQKEHLKTLHLLSIDAVVSLEANLSHWQKEFHNMTIQVLFEKIISRGGILSWIMNSSEKIWYMQVLTTFFDFLKEESARNPLLNLSEFLLVIKQMMDNKISLNLQKIVHAEKGIHFLTAHASKGLEYTYVFMIGCTSNQWEGQVKRNKGFKLPDTITETAEDHQEEDERRLFYVGLTRSKEYLEVSYPAKDANEKELVCSRFIIEMTEESAYSIEPVSLTDDEILRYKHDLLQFTEPPHIPLIDAEYLSSILENYTLSVTHLNKYLKCPISFYFENILMVPGARTASSGFGSAIHEALKDFFTLMKDGNNHFPSSDQLSSIFRMKLKNFHSHFTEIEYKNYEEYGGDIVLPQLCKTYVEEWHKNVLLEHRVDKVEMDGVPIKGNIDKIELLEGNTVNVIDYKTGKYDTSRKKLNPPNEKEPLGGDYWRQIIFYKILLENDRKKPYKVITGELDFVEPDAKTKLPTKHKIFITPEDEQVVKKQIQESYLRIMNHEFSAGCGEEDCTWCNFVRYNFTSIPDIVDQEEDV
jgi:DNA helicase-2/ATP-dependent DNA helicase PcrA